MKRPAPILTMPDAPPAFHVMAKPTGAQCNLDCAYTTVHAANGEHGREVYCFLRDECGARFVQFIPIIERVAEADANGTVPWTSWRNRPLYVQKGDVVTGRSLDSATSFRVIEIITGRSTGDGIGLLVGGFGRQAERKSGSRGTS